jgi:hypothetical protein
VIDKAAAYRIFQAFWVYFLVVNIAELDLNIKMDLIPFLHVSEILFIKYIPFVIATFVLIPFREFTGLFRDRVFLFKIIPLVILIVIAFVSSNYAQFPGTAFYTSRRMAFYTCVLIVCVTASRYFEEAPDFFIRTFIYSNVPVILGSLLDFYVPQFHVLLVDRFGRPETYHSTMSFGSERIMRPMGFLTDSNLTAFSIAIALVLLLLNYRNFGRIFRYSFFALGSYIFGMLVSRASLMVCIFTVIIFFFFKIVEKKEIYIFTAIFVLFQVITPQTYVRIISFFDKSKIESEVSYGRLVIWEASFELFKKNLIIGAGPGNFFEVSQTLIRETVLRQNPNTNLDNPLLKSFHKIDKVNPHNIFLVMLSETGLTGFTIFLVLIGSFAYTFLKQRKYVSLLFLLSIIFVSSLSNFAPHYKYYLVICIVFFIASNSDMKLIKGNAESKHQ